MVNRKHQLSKGSVVVYLALLVGCTAINVHDAPPKDWPKLTVGVKKVGFWELQGICGGGFWQQKFACPLINFNDRTCLIVYAADDETAIYAIEHEEKHCKGHDHIGSSLLRDAWSEWKRDNRRVGK